MKILIVGSILIERQYFGENIPQANQVNIVHTFKTLTSSKVINVGRILQFSHQIDMLGSIGQDHDGHVAHQHLLQYGINPQHVTSVHMPTGQVIVNTDSNGLSAINLFLGASGEFSIPEKSILSDYDYIYLETSFPISKLKQLIIQASLTNVPVFMDTPNQQPTLRTLDLKSLSFLVPNRQEAEILLDCKIITVHDALDSVTKLHNLTNGHALITLDKDGAVYFEGKPQHLPAPKVEVKDATASGDIFRAVLLDEYFKSKNLELAAQKAVLLSSQSCSYIGVDQSIQATINSLKKT